MNLSLPRSDLETMVPTQEDRILYSSKVKFDAITLSAVRIVCIAGIVLANFYGWAMTATGFVNAQFLPDNSILSNWFIPRFVAAFMQLGILAFYLTVPFFQWRHLLANAVVSFFAVSLIVISAVFALFSITLTSQSENITSGRINQLRGINEEIVQLDGLIASTFTGHLGQLNTLAERACAGLDRTGIRRCGPIAAGYAQQENELRVRYGAQLGSTGRYAQITAAPEIADAVTSLRGNFVTLYQKVAAYRDFTTETGLSSSAVNGTFRKVEGEIAGFGSESGRRSSDTKTFVLTRVFEDFGRVLSGRGDSLAYFSFAIALLPDALSIVFTALLVILRGVSAETARLRNQVREVRAEAEHYARLIKAIGMKLKAKQELATQHRMANMPDPGAAPAE